MIFDLSYGLLPKYLVHVYGWNVDDRYYFHYYNKAREKFTQLVSLHNGKGYAISISDLATDTRKDFFKG